MLIISKLEIAIGWHSLQKTYLMAHSQQGIGDNIGKNSMDSTIKNQGALSNCVSFVNLHPDRSYGCSSANQHEMQEETDRPIHQKSVQWHRVFPSKRDPRYRDRYEPAKNENN
jgi:hypothetical protein